MSEQIHKRRKRYKGTHPRSFDEKYKELNPEMYPETIEKVISKGSTPAGMHISIMVDEILEFLDIQPGQVGLDCTLGYGGHTSKMLEKLEGQGHVYGLDIDPIEIEKTTQRIRNKGFDENIFTSILINFRNIDEVSEKYGKFDFVLADLGVSSMQIDNPERGFSYKKEGPLDLRLNPKMGKPASEILKELSKEELENIIENYAKGIELYDNNIYMDIDGLISSGTENTQNTWMDAKYAGIAVTPRNGKAVEINSMWYNALKIMQELALKKGEKEKAKKYEKMANKTKNSFETKFYNKRRKCLYDVLGDNKIRPNQLFALSLTYQVIEPDSEIAENIIKVIEKQLLNPYGLKTLAKGEENYVEIYEGDEKQRDTSYHQGITWTWLLGLYYNSLKNKLKATKDKGDKEKVQTKINKFINKTEKIFTKEINESGCIGSIAEIYDSVEPQLPKGAFAQCWSVAEIFRIIIGKE